jgi:hypothetical protein
MPKDERIKHTGTQTPLNPPSPSGGNSQSSGSSGSSNTIKPRETQKDAVSPKNNSSFVIAKIIKN